MGTDKEIYHNIRFNIWESIFHIHYYIAYIIEKLHQRYSIIIIKVVVVIII